MKITFYGGAQTVTGSKYLLEVGSYKLLLDCGMHQGVRHVANELNTNLPFRAADVNAVILSHAHADHCGMLPVLVKDGFAGKIYCTAATADIAKFILEDAANIQKQDAIYFNKHRNEGEPEIEPLYTERDVRKVYDHFEPTPYFRLSKQWTQLHENVRFKFYDAGHILGSAITLLEITENDVTRRLVFTGDLGRNFLPMLRDPEFVEEPAETLIMEATYGDRLHRPVSDLQEDLKFIVRQAVAAKSKIIVPAFSLGRTQELVYIMHKLIDENQIPRIPIFLDSPLAEKITRVFGTYTSDFDEEFWTDFGERGEKAFLFRHFTMVAGIEESKKINDMPGPLMVIAGSGMCEGGRILHHLKNTISNPSTTIVITGYQAEHTLGRKLVESASARGSGVTRVNIFGQPYEVKAQVKTLNELSAHADQKDLLAYVQGVKDLKQVFLVHTEPRQAEVFKNLVGEKNPDIAVNVPSFGQSFEV